MRQIQIAVNGIPRAPTFTHISYGLVSDVSDNGQKIAGVYGTFQSPFWLWDKTDRQTISAASGFLGGISGNGRVVGGSSASTRTRRMARSSSSGPRSGPRKGLEVDREHPVRGLRRLPYERLRPVQRRIDGRWSRFRRLRECVRVQVDRQDRHDVLPKVSENQQCQDPSTGETYGCEGASRANAVSGTGTVVGGWEEIPEVGGFRVGSIWQGNVQTLLRDPSGNNAIGGWIGEVMGVNSAGTIAVGLQAGRNSRTRTCGRRPA